MVLPEKFYVIVKWILMIAVPAFITFFTLLCNTWKWDIPLEAIVATISGAATFFGIIVGISNYNYYKNQE